MTDSAAPTDFALLDAAMDAFAAERPALPLAVAGVLTWTVPGLEGGGRLLWAYATFSLMMLAYTVLAMPYSALRESPTTRMGGGSAASAAPDKGPAAPASRIERIKCRRYKKRPFQ